MKITRGIVGLLVGFIALPWMGAFAQAPAAFTVQLLGTFDYPGAGNQTRPQKINDGGDIVGVYVDSSGVSRGFVLRPNGTFSAPIVDPKDTGNLTEGRGINNSHLVCGDYLDSTSGTYHGFFLMGTNFTNYDVPGSSTTILLGLNNAGDFCGSVTPTGGVQEAFLNIGGVVTEFAIRNATASLAYQLNDSNQSCGYYIDASTITHGFFRDSDGSIKAPIDPVGSTGTILFGNNDRDLIVGRYSDSSGATHGLLFVMPNQFVVYDYPGATFTSLNGINQQGLIVGRYTDSSGIDHGILARAVHGASDSVSLPLAPPSKSARALPLRAAATAPAF